MGQAREAAPKGRGGLGGRGGDGLGGGGAYLAGTGVLQLPLQHSVVGLELLHQHGEAAQVLH